MLRAFEKSGNTSGVDTDAHSGRITYEFAAHERGHALFPFSGFIPFFELTDFMLFHDPVGGTLSVVNATLVLPKVILSPFLSAVGVCGTRR